MTEGFGGKSEPCHGDECKTTYGRKLGVGDLFFLGQDPVIPLQKVVGHAAALESMLWRPDEADL